MARYLVAIAQAFGAQLRVGCDSLREPATADSRRDVSRVSCRWLKPDSSQVPSMLIVTPAAFSGVSHSSL